MLNRFFFLFAFLATAFGWAETPAQVAHWSAELHEAKLDLSVTLKEGWHLYSLTQPAGGPIATRISFPSGSAVTQAGEIVAAAPKKALDPSFGIETETYVGSAKFEIPVKVAQGAAGVNVRFQVCNDRLCLPPSTAKLEIPGFAAMAATSAAATPPVATAATPSPVTPVQAQQQPLSSFLWFAMGMGALSLLTPCVFPMVPITVSYFSNHGSSSRRGAVFQALVYGFGIILTFSAIGLILALAFGAGGVNQLAANPWVNLLITVIFVGFAFSLFGAYMIQLPTGLMTSLNIMANNREAGGVIGALLMGLTFSLTSFTCTAPFVGTLLVTAATGNWHWPLAGMVAYSTVFALPFFALALAPQLVSQLPKAGGWMNSVKVVMGFLEIAAAMKFLSNADLVWRWGIFTRDVVLAVWISVGLLIVLYIFGFFRFEHDSPPQHVSAGRVFAALCFLAITISLVPGMFGRSLGELESFLPPASEEVQASTAGGSQWILNDLDKARTVATQQNKPIFIDFTGYTCTNCRWMEANIFPKAQVQAELAKFVTVRLYTDGDGPVFEKQQKYQQDTFGTVALPLYVILDGSGKTVATFPGLTRRPEEFSQFLQRGLPGSSAAASTAQKETPSALSASLQAAAK